MKFQEKCLFSVATILSIVIFGTCSFSKFVLLESNARISRVSDVATVFSLLECAVMVENNINTVSFSYNSDYKTCELSKIYPDELTFYAENWKVFYKLVNGAWTEWTSWSICTRSPTAMRTRTRNCSDPAPGKGGEPCLGQSVMFEPCHALTCFNDSNICVSDFNATWENAKTECEAVNANLVIFENQEVIDYLATKLGAFHHWIGMTFDNDLICTWIDGRNVSGDINGAWAPYEPLSGGCVWIGYFNDKLDDAYCNNLFPFICEYEHFP